MRLNDSYSLLTFIYIHLILIHIIFVRLPLGAQGAENVQEEADLYEIPQANKNKIIEHVKENLLKVMGLKAEPKKITTKAFVPFEMLEEYRKNRESMREFIPDDRNYYGKLDMNDLERRQEDIWSNREGLEVDMGPDERSKRNFHVGVSAERISYIPPNNDPENVPSRSEHRLPPHPLKGQSQKQFLSVHLRFNLSQELYIKPTSPDELRGAELHLTRERIYDCEFNNNCHRNLRPFFTNTDRNQKNDGNGKSSTDSPTSLNSGSGDDGRAGDNGSTRKSNDSEDDKQIDSSSRTNNLRNRPRYQRVFILHVTGYDDRNFPVTRIHDSQRIDTLQSTTLSFDIYEIVKSWLRDPTKNYGIIVRVTNEDEEYKQQVTNSALNLKEPTNASTRDTQRIAGVEEHVRLKREFRSTSESEESWSKKRPSLLIYTTDISRRHVKRDHTASDDIDGMQADEQSRTSTNDYSSSSDHSTTQSTTDPTTQDNVQNRDNLQTQTNIPIDTSTMSSSSSSSKTPQLATGRTMNGVSRRDSRQTNGAEHQQRSVGPVSRPSTSGSPRNRIKGKSQRLTEKCSVRTLVINFEEVGWTSWIIAPREYYANYCAGDCTFPMSDHQNASNHAIIQAIYNTVRTTIPRSCCAPVKLGSMKILYQLDGTVEMRGYDDMIVESCGCL